MEENNHQNFLQSPHAEAKKSRWRGWLAILILPFRLLPVFVSWFAIAALVILIVLSLAAIPYIESIRFIATEALAGKQVLEEAQAQFFDQDFLRANKNLQQAATHFGHAEEELKDISTRTLFKIPSIKEQVDIADNILVVGRSLSVALRDVALFGHDVVNITGQKDLNFGEIPEEQRAAILSKLSDLGPQLLAAKEEIGQAQLVWDTLSKKKNVFLWRPVLKPLQENVPLVFKGFDLLILASDTVPDLVGYPEQKNYLFLMLNNNELRPGGGFIGTYGIVKVKNGNLQSFETDNIYNLDVQVKQTMHIAPPRPFQDYMNLTQWFMRDSNWWPDFPTSARKTEEFYHLEARPGEKIDGVIAINPDLIEDLLKLVGPIQVEDLRLDEHNFTDQLQYQVEFGYYKQGIPEADRKDIIGVLSEKLQERIFALPVEQWTTLFDIVRENIERKHILGYFKDQDIQDFIDEREWSGRVKLTKDDYLQIVDANMGALKTDRVMNRKVRYAVFPDRSNLVSELQINYKNTGTFDEFTTRYRSYTRVYVPRGAKLRRLLIGREEVALADVEIFQEFDKTAFGFFFEVEPQQDKTIILEYQLPKHVVESNSDGDYKLLVQKQPGMREFDLELDMTFPDALKVFNSTAGTNNLQFSDLIIKDQLYTILFR